MTVKLWFCPINISELAFLFEDNNLSIETARRYIKSCVVSNYVLQLEKWLENRGVSSKNVRTEI